VTLPATPTEKWKDIESGIRMRSYYLRSGASEYCVIWMTGLPEVRLETGSLNFLLPRALADMLKSARQAGKTDLVTTHYKDLTFNRYNGRDVVMESAGDKIEARGYIVGHDFVAIAVMHRKEQEASGEASRFLDSFALADSRPPQAERGDQTDSSGRVLPSSEVDKKPFPLNKPRPNYTDEARNHRVQGIVRVRALVDIRGRVQDVRLISHLPYGLDEEAIKAVRQMGFKPAVKDRQPVEYWVILEVEFRLGIAILLSL
jgi:TonB family protein